MRKLSIFGITFSAALLAASSAFAGGGGDCSPGLVGPPSPCYINGQYAGTIGPVLGRHGGARFVPGGAYGYGGYAHGHGGFVGGGFVRHRSISAFEWHRRTTQQTHHVEWDAVAKTGVGQSVPVGDPSCFRLENGYIRCPNR